jgi:branched-chain amino acid transport system substrate-binding protein
MDLTYSLRSMLLLGFTAAAVAACGSTSTSTSSSAAPASSAATSASSGTSTAASASSGTTATGSPIKIGNISPVSGVLAYPGVAAAVKAAVRDVNDHGGIAGHPIDLIFCDEASDPNKAAACARTMVSNHVAATVGDFSPTGEQNITPILAAAKIPQIGTFAFSTALSDPYNFLLVGAQPGVDAASAYQAKLAGKKWGAAVLDLAISQAYTKYFGSVAASSGATMTVAKSPITATDVSSSASTLAAAKPDIIILLTTGQQATQIALDAKQLGYTGKFVVDLQAYSASTVGQIAPVAGQTVFASQLPPVSASTQYPALNQFFSDMKAEAASGDSAAEVTPKFVQDSTVDGWLAVIALQKIAGAASATTSSAILTAFRSAKNVPLGLVASWTPNKPGPAAFPRISNTTYYFEKLDSSGALVLASPPSTDVASLLGS